MLQINISQIETLACAGEDNFIKAEVERLFHNYKDFNKKDAPPDEAWVREGFELGRQYGLYSEEDFARFNDLRLAEGEAFPSESDLEILNDQDLWGWQKLDELEGVRIYDQVISTEL